MISRTFRNLTSRDYSGFAIDVICLSALGLSLLVLRSNYLLGGEMWNQGDWLINNELVFVRRGMLGSFLIHISDFFSLSPIFLTIAVQAICFAFGVLMVWLLCRFTVPTRLGLLLISSSAFYILFFPSVSTDDAFRKELISFVAILLEIYALYRSRHDLLIVSAFLFSVSVFAHEALILFSALYIFVLLYFKNQKIGQVFRYSLSAAVILVIGYAGYIAFRYGQIPDPAFVCKPLLDRGIQSEFCDGAIAWLNRPLAFFFLEDLSFTKGIKFLIAYSLALVPYLYILKVSKAPKHIIVLIALAALPFFPLYLIAIDWGRWLAFHIFSIFCILICAYHRGDLNFPSQSQGRHLVLISFLALSFSQSHIIGLFPGGFFRRFVVVIYHQVMS